MHRIVYETFKGEIPSNLEINHIDSIKTNNHITNLEAVTKSENLKHRYKNMKPVDGENNPMAILKEKDILTIYNMVKMGEIDITISEKFNLHERYVSLIRHGKRWNYMFKKHMKKNTIFGL